MYSSVISFDLFCSWSTKLRSRLLELSLSVQTDRHSTGLNVLAIEPEVIMIDEAHSEHGPIILGILWVEFVLAMLLVAARVYTATSIVKDVGMDSSLAIATMVSLDSFSFSSEGERSENWETKLTTNSSHIIDHRPSLANLPHSLGIIRSGQPQREAVGA